MDIRKEIKSILMEVISEAVPSIHFNYRVYSRLTSSLYTRPSFDFADIEDQIELIKKTNFSKEASFAIQLKSFPETYISKDPDTGKPSIGNEIWAVVRDNVITTIFFRNSSQRNTPVSNVDNTIMLKTLVKNYNIENKNPDGTVDFKIGDKSHKQGKGQRKKVEFDMPFVEINGKKWYIDESNEELIYAKNIKKKLSFDDLKEEVLEKVIDAATVQSAV